MVQKLRERSKGEGGFTLVELLVVMLILGLLAAIAIPSFFNQREKATDADAKASARTAQTAIETYATDNGGSYANATPTNLRAIEETLSETGGNPERLGVTSGADTYTVSVTSARTGGPVFSVSRTAAGGTTYTCTPVESGGCPSDGTWGD